MNDHAQYMLDTCAMTCLQDSRIDLVLAPYNYGHCYSNSVSFKENFL